MKAQVTFSAIVLGLAALSASPLVLANSGQSGGYHGGPGFNTTRVVVFDRGWGWHNGYRVGYRDGYWGGNRVVFYGTPRPYFYRTVSYPVVATPYYNCKRFYSCNTTRNLFGQYTRVCGFRCL